MMFLVSDPSINLRRIKIINTLLCIVGIVLSCYAYHVEIHKERDSRYTAMCDISAHMSCSKVFTSKFGRGFGLLEYIVGRESLYNQPNSVFGITLYVVVLLCGLLRGKFYGIVCLSMGVPSCIGSVYLAAILYFVLYDFCVVCVTTYLVNLLLFLCSMWRLRIEGSLAKEKRR